MKNTLEFTSWLAVFEKNKKKKIAMFKNLHTRLISIPSVCIFIKTPLFLDKYAT